VLLVDILDLSAVEGLDSRWDSVLVFNLLEHVYDPIRAVETALSRVEANGLCLSGLLSSDQRVPLLHLPVGVCERSCAFHSSRRTWSTAC
jgi:hypothetical protein